MRNECEELKQSEKNLKSEIRRRGEAARILLATKDEKILELIKGKRSAELGAEPCGFHSVSTNDKMCKHCYHRYIRARAKQSFPK